MIRSGRICIGAFLACVCLAALVVASSAGGATIVYEPESQTVLLHQLATGQVQSVTVNKRVRSLRVTLKDGTHVLVKYPAHHEAETVARLKAKGVTVAILSQSQAEAEAKKKPVHHKLRYIAGGILIVVIIVVVAVLLIDRRRKMRLDE
jgi:hypothetical protein